MKRLSRQLVPYLIAIWVAFLALSGMTPCCDLSAAAASHSHAEETEHGYGPADHGGGGSPHPYCCQLSNAEYDMAKAGGLTDALRIPAPVFLLATVDAGLLPRQAIEALLERPTIHPPPLKQPLYILIKRFLI